MCENVNINVQETNETINIVSSEIQEVIDINVFETTEDVTLNITEEIIQVNINKVTAAEQIQSDWAQTDNEALDFIKNKPTIPAAVTNTSDLTNDGEDGVHPFITAEDLPSLTGYVPYTGATQNVNLGEYELKAGQLTLDTSPTGTAAVATTRWNDSIGSSETTLKGGTVVLKNGVDLVARVVNKVTPNATLLRANYTAVRISGAQGQRLAVAYAQANNDNNSADTIGLVCENIATNQEGFIMTMGQFEEINTTGSLQGETWVDGDVLYLSPTTAGRLTNIKPTGITGHIVVMGYVEYAHANHGKIYVKIMNGWELDELHNVYINSPVNNEGLFYDSADSVWKNKTIATALGYTPQQQLVSGTNIKTINGASVLGSGDLVVGGSNIYNADGTLTSARTVTSGGFPLTFTGSNTAASAIARGLNLTHTLVAAANSDSLVALDITPTFTLGAFTGVSTFGLRLNKSVTTAPATFTNTNDILLRNSASATSNSLVSHSPAVYYNGNTYNGIANVPISFRQYLQAGLGGGNTVGILSFEGSYDNAAYAQIASIRTGSLAGSNQFRVIGNTNTIGSVPNNAAAFIAGNGNAGVAINSYGNGAAEIQSHQSTAINNVPLLINRQGGNVLIATTTDAGFKLDVNGTARVNGNLTLQSGSQKELFFDSQGIKIRHSLNGLGNNIIIGWNGATIATEATTQRSIIIGFFNRGNIPTNSTIVATNTDLTGYTSTSPVNIFGGQVTLNASSGLYGNYIACSGTVLGDFSGLFASDAGSAELPPVGTNIPTIIGCGINNPTQSTPNIYLGQWGCDSTLPTSSRNVFVSATNGVGTNVEGYNLVFSSGRSTGTAISKDIIFSTATPTTTGTTLQTLTQRWFIKGSSGILANVSTPNASAQLQVDSTTQGFLPPRMTTTQKNAIATPAAGLMIYDNTLNRPCFYDGTTWITL
jgi:hypothetical protein